MVRNIILLEHQPNSLAMVAPPEGYVETCNATFEDKPYRVSVDRNGFIETHRGDPKDSPSIIVLGGSTIENYFIDEDRRACSVLENHLFVAGHDHRVLNGGVSGMSTLNALNNLLNKAVPMKPSCVFLVTGPTDVSSLSVGKSALWAGAILPKRIVEPTGFCLDERLACLRLIRAVCHECCIPLCLMTFGYTLSAPKCYGFVNTPIGARECLDRFMKVNEQTRDFAETNRLDILDLQVSMNDREDLFYDGLHPNMSGCDLIGRSMVSYALSSIER